MKSPRAATLGLFYSVLGGWLIPKAGYQLFISVQPFADVVGNYTCQNGEKKRCEYIQVTHPPFRTCLGVVARELYHKEKIKYSRISERFSLRTIVVPDFL